ncbi:MAG: hypothetical protein OES53_09655 [Xanthomonadales bacterium]|jgi:hypothetical protein|nr:hypothetical protein [Xanthomonadales bacterium]MDH4002842.1 hypothetical protein [Xanthomonadales bacterium]
MGITYFVVFIASILAGILIFLFKNLAESVLLGEKDNLPEPGDLRQMQLENEIERRRASEYIHNYMVSLDQARCERERRRKLKTL